MWDSYREGMTLYRRQLWTTGTEHRHIQRQVGSIPSVVTKNLAVLQTTGPVELQGPDIASVDIQS